MGREPAPLAAVPTNAQTLASMRQSRHVPPPMISKGSYTELTFYAVALSRTLVSEQLLEGEVLVQGQLAQTTLRSVLGKHMLDEMLAERDQLNADIQEILDRQTEGWGVKVTNVEIKQVDLDHSMVRAIARQAEAERIRRAKVINAEGEQQAAEKLVEAAQILAKSPGAMQLRYLATLSEIASERSSTIVFPFPLDLVKAFSPTGDHRPP